MINFTGMCQHKRFEIDCWNPSACENLSYVNYRKAEISMGLQDNGKCRCPYPYLPVNFTVSEMVTALVVGPL